MKRKLFYAHLVETSSITIEIADMDLTKEERLHLLALVNSNIHNAVLDTVLSALSEEDKKIFLTNLDEDNQDKIWGHLNTKIDSIEDKIKNAIEDLKEDLHKDIKQVKKLSSK